MKKMTVFLAGAVVFTAGTLMAAPPRHNKPAPPPKKVVVTPQRHNKPAPPQKKVVVAPQRHNKPAPPPKKVVVVKPNRPAPPPPRHHNKPPRPRYTFGGGLFNPLNWFF